MTKRIRLALEDDLARIVEIYNHAVLEGGATADLSPITVESRQQWFKDHSPESWPIWLLENADEVMGWCSLSAYRPGRMALRQSAEISYYVHRDHRRQGVARQLIDHAISQCPSLGIRHLFTFMLDVNEPSIQVLKSFGFEQWGHMPNVADLGNRTCGHLILGRSVD